MALENIPFGDYGIMEINGDRFPVIPQRLDRKYGEEAILTCVCRRLGVSRE